MVGARTSHSRARRWRPCAGPPRRRSARGALVAPQPAAAVEQARISRRIRRPAQHRRRSRRRVDIDAATARNALAADHGRARRSPPRRRSTRKAISPGATPRPRRSTDPLQRVALEWIALRRRASPTSARLAAFAAAHPDWPAGRLDPLSRRRRRSTASAPIPSSQSSACSRPIRRAPPAASSPSRAPNWRAGQRDRAAALVRGVWRDDDLDGWTEAALLAEFSAPVDAGRPQTSRRAPALCARRRRRRLRAAALAGRRRRWRSPGSGPAPSRSRCHRRRLGRPAAGVEERRRASFSRVCRRCAAPTACSRPPRCSSSPRATPR